MADLYPLYADLDGKRCLVVGAGGVATRKVKALLKAGALVTIVAPKASSEIEKLAGRNLVDFQARGFVEGDVEGMALVFAATDDPQTNRMAAQAASRCGVWANQADDPESSDFHVPASLTMGEIGLVLSTSGASPLLAVWLRDRAGEALPEGVERLARLCALLRGEERFAESETSSWRNLFESGIIEDLARGDLTAAEEKILETFGAAPDFDMSAVL